MKKPIKPKGRDPASHLKALGALRQRVIPDRTKELKADRSKQKAKLAKGCDDDE
tara:strand:- start:326 stop:487 length:162 start_codon:yes stop_codon:yes gene_type:complete